MSYILDALKKSEKARQQDAGAPKYSLLPVVDDETSPRQIWPYVLAAGLLINAAVVYVWLRPGPSTGTPVVNTSTTPSPPGAAKVEAAAVAPSPLVREAAAILPAPRVAVPLQMPPARAGGPATSPEPALREATVKPAVAIAPRDGLRIPMRPPDAGGRPAAETAAAKPTASAPGEKPTPRKNAAGAADQAAAAVQGLPLVSVSGIIHGEGSDAMAIVNDKLVREGEEIMPGLMLEKIQGDGVLLNYKGQRFTR